MRELVRKILQILDGTPAVYGKKQRGQSIVEMTIITPLLIFWYLALWRLVGWQSDISRYKR